jgi:hypothetical protein
MSNIIILQDTTRQKEPVLKDTVNLNHDITSTLRSLKSPLENVLTDSESFAICPVNNYGYLTFKDSAGLITKFNSQGLQDFVFDFTAKNKSLAAETREVIKRKLKPGEDLPGRMFHYDWILPVILLSVMIFGIIKSESLKMITGLLRFVSFRGINEPASRDLNSIYQWQSTILNFASFINISIFAFFAVTWFDLSFQTFRPYIIWIIILAIIVGAVTIRHLICIIIGNMSGEKEVFREYLVSIYQGYRLSGILLLVVSILIAYTDFIQVKTLIYIGFSAFSLQYLIRVLRLFIIFINRHVSIFYLILYLCALEILPVVILVKYVTGLN